MCAMVFSFLAEGFAQKNLKAIADRHYLSAMDLRSRSNYEHSSQEFLNAGRQYMLLTDQAASGALRTEYQNKYFICMLSICENLMQIDKCDRALVLCNVLIIRLERLSDAGNLLYEAYKTKAHLLTVKRNYTPALECIQKALDLAYIHRTNPAVAQANIHQLRARWFAGQNLWDKAQDYLEKALSLLMDKDQAILQLKIGILNDLSRIYFEQNRFYEALTIIHGAENLLQSEKLQNSDLAGLYLHKSEIYKRSNQSDSSLFYAQKAIRNYESLGAVNEPKLADAHLIAGQYYLKIGNMKDAFEHFRKMIAIRSYVYGTNHVKLSDAHFHVSELYLAQRDYPKAKNELDQGYKILEQYSVFDTVQYLRAFILYADWYTHQKKMTQAGYALGKAKELASGSSILMAHQSELLWDYYRRQFTALMSAKNYQSARNMLTDANLKLASDSRFSNKLRWLNLVLETATTSDIIYQNISTEHISTEARELKKVEPLDRIRRLKALGLF